MKSLNNHNFPKDIKRMFQEYDKNNFCHSVVMLAQHNDFSKYIENEGPIEHLFNLCIEYNDNINKPNKQDNIWLDISKTVKTIN